MPAPLHRRQFLRRSAAATAATWGASVWAPGIAQARARTLSMAASPDGTTLASALGPDGEGLYVRLTETPGWPTVVRELEVSADDTRTDRRRALASIVHLTDVHIVDAQSPARVEFLDRDSDPPQESLPVEGAFRPHEMMSTQISDAMNRQVRSVGAGPITGRAYDLCVSTGDNIDNQQVNELSWFMKLLDGGSQLTPNSGDMATYEGVQDLDVTTYDTHYWHPEDGDNLQGPDRYKTVYGFPSMPGLLDAAITPFTPVGIGVRWYSCYGNHDGLLQGNAPTNALLEGIATGPFKVTSRPGGLTSGDILDGLASQDPTAITAVFSGPGRQVTADAQRATATVEGWIQAHLDSPSNPGPVGHGYTEDALNSLELHYTFPIAEGVLGICLDTVNRGGYAEGSIGAAQMAWLEAQLVGASSSYLDSAGTVVTGDADDQLIVLFSHHNLSTLENPFPDPNQPEERILGGPIEELLHRFANVILWVNGHSHVNRVTPFPDPASATGGFWEVSTAAHIDFPMHSRIIELVDNADGTLSIFGTILEHAGPAKADLSSDVLDLASIAREIGWNDPQSPPSAGLGEPGDRNVELMLAAPFALGSVGAPVDDSGAPVDAPDEDTGGAPDDPVTDDDLAATGGGAALLGAAAIAASAVLRRRTSGLSEGGLALGGLAVGGLAVGGLSHETDTGPVADDR